MRSWARAGLWLLLLNACGGTRDRPGRVAFRTSDSLNRQRAGCFVMGFGRWYTRRGPAPSWPRPWEYAEVRLAAEPLVLSRDTIGDLLRVGPAPSLGRDTIYVQKAKGSGNDLWLAPSTSAFADGWIPVAWDSIELRTLSAGMGQHLRLAVRGDTLRGRAHRIVSDIRSGDDEPRTNAYGVRFDCAGSAVAARQALERLLAADRADSALGAREQQQYDSVTFPPQ